MTTKTKFSKNLLLSTASVLAMLTAGSDAALGMGAPAVEEAKNSVALGAQLYLNKNKISRISDKNSFLQENARGRPTNNSESILFFGEANNLILDVSIGNLGTLNLMGYDGQTVFVTANNQLVNIINDASDKYTNIFNDCKIGKYKGTINVDDKNVLIDAYVNFDIKGATMTFGAADGTGDLSALGDISFSGPNSNAIFNTDFDNGSSVTVNDGATNTWLNSVNGNQIFQNLTIGKGADIWIDPGIQFNNLITALDNSTVNFDNGYNLQIPINNTNSSKIQFWGDATINMGNSLGSQAAPFAQISFADNSNVTLSNDIYANPTIGNQSIIANNVTFALQNNVKISGNLNADNITINVDNNQLTYVGQYAPTGDVVFNITINKQGNCGTITVEGAGSTIDLSKANSATINVDYNDENGVGTYPGVLYFANGGAINGADRIQVTPNADVPNIVWSYNPDQGSITAKNNVQDDPLPPPPQDIVKPVTQSVIIPANTAAIDSTITDTPVTTASQTTTPALTALEKSTMRQSSDHGLILKNSRNPMAYNRVAYLVAVDIEEAQNGFGVAAGDDTASKYGAWINGFMAKGRQGTYKDNSSNKSNTTGGAIGFDGMVSDNLTLGASVGMVDAKLKYSGDNIGDRTKVRTTLFSLYGIQNLSNTWFVQSMVSFGNNKVSLDDNLNDGSGIVKTSKYTAKSYSGEIAAGYNYNAGKSTVITPTLGIRYTDFNDPAYTKYGIEDVDIKKSTVNKFEALTGVRVSTTTTMNSLTLVPEAHANINWEISSKDPRIDSRAMGINDQIPTTTQSSDKILANLGTGITARHKMVDLSLTYDAQLSNKFVGHQGSVKLRINL